MTEIMNVEERAKILLEHIENRTEQVRQDAILGSDRLDLNGPGLVGRAGAVRAKVEDLSDLLIVERTLRVVLGQGNEVITRLSTGEQICFPEEQKPSFTGNPNTGLEEKFARADVRTRLLVMEALEGEPTQ